MSLVRAANRFESLPTWTDKTRSPNMYQIRRLSRQRRDVRRRDVEREVLVRKEQGKS